MSRFARAWLTWTVLWIGLLVVAFLASEGEPVCEGPLILGVDDSDPRQCDDPVAGLPTVGLTLYIPGFTVATAFAAAWTRYGTWKSKHA